MLLQTPSGGVKADSRPAAWLPQDAEAGGGLMVAVVQLAITLGATVGGLLFDMSGHASTFGMSAALLVLAAVAAGMTARIAGART